MEYYEYLPLKKNIIYPGIIEEYIFQYIQTEYLLVDARNMGLFEADTFLLDQRNYKNNVLYSEYIKKEIIEKYPIDSTEIEIRYSQEQDRYKEPQIIRYSVYLFDQLNNALAGRQSLLQLMNRAEEFNTDEALSIPGLLKVETEKQLNIDEADLVSEETYSTLLSTPMGYLADNPIPVGEQYIYIQRTGEDKLRTKKLEDVREEIHNRLVREKVDQELMARVEYLKQQYAIEIDKTGIE